jgi:hypothetical protein
MNLQYTEDVNKNKLFTKEIPMKGKKMTSAERKNKLESDKLERRKVFRELLTHLQRGLSLTCFGPLSDSSIYEYCKTYPEEFKAEELQEALRQGKNWWESIGQSQTNGSCMGNSRTWFYNMANRYGWRDKVDIESDNKHSLNVNVVSYATSKTSKLTENKDQT